MNVTLKLFASLSDYLPSGAKGNRLEIEVDEQETVAAVIERHRLPEKMVHLVLVNGLYIAPGDRLTYRLKPADQLAIWPPIAGG